MLLLIVLITVNTVITVNNWTKTPAFELRINLAFKNFKERKVKQIPGFTCEKPMKNKQMATVF